MIYIQKVSLCSWCTLLILFLLEEEKEAKFWLRKYIKWSHKSIVCFQLVFLILHHFSHHLLLMKKQGSQQEFCYLLWSFKLARISGRDSKSGKMIVTDIPLGGLGDRDLSSPFGFWQWGSSNTFHSYFCFLCSASGIENKPKKQGKARASSGSDAGVWEGPRQEQEFVCVCEDVEYWRICEGLCRDAGCTSIGNWCLWDLLL